MDYNSQTCDLNKITKNKTDNIQSSNLVYTCLLRACEEADAGHFDVQSTAVAAKDDFSILWNEQMQSLPKFMDTNLDDIEMNDELLDKLVTAILQDNTFDLHIHSDTSNMPVQPQLSCNNEIQEANSTIGVSDNTFQIWQKLIEGDNSISDLSHIKLNANSRSVSFTPRQISKSPSKETIDHSLIRTRSQRRRETQQKAPQQHSTATASPPSTASNSSKPSPDWQITPSYSSGPMSTLKEIWKECSHSTTSSDPRLSPTSDSSRRYYLRSSAGSQSDAKSVPDSSTESQQTPADMLAQCSHRYATRSKSGSSKATADKGCAKLAVVLRRARMSTIARLQRRRSSVWLTTPKKRLEPRRLYSRKAKTSARKKNEQYVLSALRR